MGSQHQSLTAAHLASVAAFYESAPVDSRWGARSYRKVLAHYYNLLIPPDAHVLEIGCGSGELLAQLRAAKKTGIDLSAQQIAVARQRVPGATFQVQAGETLDLNERYDVII